MSLSIFLISRFSSSFLKLISLLIGVTVAVSCNTTRQGRNSALTDAASTLQKEHQKYPRIHSGDQASNVVCRSEDRKIFFADFISSSSARNKYYLDSHSPYFRESGSLYALHKVMPGKPDQVDNEGFEFIALEGGGAKLTYLSYVLWDLGEGENGLIRKSISLELNTGKSESMTDEKLLVGTITSLNIDHVNVQRSNNDLVYEETPLENQLPKTYSVECRIDKVLAGLLRQGVGFTTRNRAKPPVADDHPDLSDIEREYSKFDFEAASGTSPLICFDELMDHVFFMSLSGDFEEKSPHIMIRPRSLANLVGPGIDDLDFSQDELSMNLILSEWQYGLKFNEFQYSLKVSNIGESKWTGTLNSSNQGRRFILAEQGGEVIKTVDKRPLDASDLVLKHQVDITCYFDPPAHGH